MRGKERDASSALLGSGITPAHAGKRRFADVAAQHIQDHPRPCGEKLLTNGQMSQEQGSPPPMRGKECAHNLAQYLARITPAHAGKSVRASARGRSPRDHPRPCGEKKRGGSAGGKAGGSPPPMRGKARSLGACPLVPRITPGHAGKRRVIRAIAPNCEDHPRPCGEKATSQSRSPRS